MSVPSETHSVYWSHQHAGGIKRSASRTERLVTPRGAAAGDSCAGGWDVRPGVVGER
jgi:hypothetical protein